MKNIKNQIKEIIREELNKIKENMSSKWDSLSHEQREDLISTVVKDPDDYLKYIGWKWAELPDEITNLLDTIQDNELNENEMDFNKGDIVKIDPFLDTDPYSKRGEEGIISDFDDEIATIKFDDGITGKYQWGTFSKVDIEEAGTYAGNKSIDDLKKDPDYNTLNPQTKTDVEKKLKTGGSITVGENNSSKTSFTGRPITESLNDRFKRLLNS
jgi:hypothetical protein